VKYLHFSGHLGHPILTMARIREINYLKWEDVHSDYLILRTRKAKNSVVAERKIPIWEGLREVIEQIPKKGEYVFINPVTGKPYDYRSKFLGNLCTKAKEKKFSFHALRHFGANRLADEGVPITDIQALLGHQRATTTDIYLRGIRPSLKEAVKKLGMS
jgi:integrase